MADSSSLETSLKPPSHVAVIMDGNSRWAKRRLLPVSMGHKAGAKAVGVLVNAAIDFKVKYLTIYAFSTENWQRPEEEVNYLMDMLSKYLDSEVNQLIEKGVKIVISGDLSKVSESMAAKINRIVDLTKNNKSIILNVAFNYGSRAELSDAVKKIVLAIENQKITLDMIDEDLISKNLYQPNIPDPDLIIRTSGEKRLSNFLLWQAAYSELYFTKRLWPNFRKIDLHKAILSFNQRKRNYGKR